MPSAEWSAKRKRQYQHIKDSVLARGQSESLAEEIAARTVNKERAQHGESVEASASSINDMPAGRRGGEAACDRTKEPADAPLHSFATRPSSAASRGAQA